MSAFGAATSKPTVLFTNKAWIAELMQMGRRTITNTNPLSLVVRSEVNGHVNVYGNSDLKASQAYPPGFGKALVKLFKKHHQSELAGALTLTHT
jgi:hypothetical protein